MSALTDEPRRLFFALWPPADVIDRLRDLVQELHLSGHPIPPDHLHLTLAFHGTCDETWCAALMAKAEHVTWPEIELVFDRLGWFRRPRIAWLGMSAMPEPLIALASALGNARVVHGRFVPHISLARKAPPIAAVPVRPMGWIAREFALVESGANGRSGAYRTLARWPAKPAEV